MQMSYYPTNIEDFCTNILRAHFYFGGDFYSSNTERLSAIFLI